MFTGPGAAAWGTVVNDREIEVSIERDSRWARITYVSGLEQWAAAPRGVRCDLDFAWLARAAVTLPPPDPPLETTVVAVVPGAAMPTPRHRHTATLLPNGRVAVIGGEGPGGTAVGTTEIYDPSKDVWSAAEPMRVPRSGHTATLLGDGTVLVVGGSADARVEIFDPRRHAWRLANPALEQRHDHTATRLRDGSVLVAGGAGAEQAPRRCDHEGCTGGAPALATSDIYDPSRDLWRRVGGLGAARTGHTATLLRDGRVVVAGGDDPSIGSRYRHGYVSAAEVYDPTLGRWTPAGKLDQGRTGHAAAALLDGRVLVTGGWVAPAVPRRLVRDAEAPGRRRRGRAVHPAPRHRRPPRHRRDHRLHAARRWARRPVLDADGGGRRASSSAISRRCPGCDRSSRSRVIAPTPATFGKGPVPCPRSAPSCRSADRRGAHGASSEGADSISRRELMHAGRTASQPRASAVSAPARGPSPG